MTIHVSIGDPSGIGPEIVFNSLKSVSINSNIIVHIPLEHKDFFYDYFDCHIEEYDKKLNQKISAIFYKSDVDNFPKGKLSKESGKIAAGSIISAVNSIDNSDDVLITAPINKEALNMAGYHYHGHTEMLQDLTSSKMVFMSFWGKINTLLITTHVSMKSVVEFVANTDNVKTKIIESYPFVSNFFNGKKPKLALCALNPHAGENGMMGKEDEALACMVKELIDMGYDISGPYPSDTIFYRYLKGEFDFIYSIYHDQALIPIKTQFFNESVNMTLGLPFIRISPDHGTAFDIAYKNMADISSMEYCFKFANNIKNISRLR